MAGPTAPPEDSDLTAYRVTVGGTPLPDYFQLVVLVVSLEVNRIPSARIELNDGDSAKRDFSISGGEVFKPGLAVQIELGYGSATEPVFSGFVAGQRIRMATSGRYFLQVDVLHNVAKLNVGRNSAVYNDQADSAVLSNLFSAHGVQVSPPSGGASHAQLVQHYATDWDFAMARIQANGWVLAPQSADVKILALAAAGSATRGLEFGDNVHAFSLELDGMSQVPSVTCSAWSYAEQALISGQASSSNANSIGQYASSALAQDVGNTAFKLQTSAGLVQADVDAWAKAEVGRHEFAKVRGFVTYQGSNDTQPGDVVSLAGFGETYNGTAYVAGIEHRVESGVWSTSARLGVAAVGFTECFETQAALASGVVPGVQGLLNGVVQAVSDDPGKSYRVKVSIPVWGQSAEPVWARLGNAYASNQVGFVFYPEVGDEVILGFINGDPREPVIIGSAYSGSKKVPPLPPDQDNNQKGIVTRAKLKLLLDEQKPSVTIETPGGRKFVLDDKTGTISLADGAGNLLEMSSSGIKIQTSKKLTLSADQGITATSSGGAIELDAASQSVKASAGTVEIQAQQSVEVSGTLSATLKSGMSTIIKGTMVEIN